MVRWFMIQHLDEDCTAKLINCRDAWFAQRGVSRTEAKRRYISTLVDTMHAYASQTVEARELVAELEFVWDQVKSNISSSSASSPMQSAGVPPLPQPQPQPSYGSIGAQLAQFPEYQYMASTARGDSRLRVLSPVSQPDDVYGRRATRMDHDCEQGLDQADDEDDESLGEDEEEEEYAEAQANLYEDEDEQSDEVGGVIDENEDSDLESTNHIPDGIQSRKRNRKHHHNGKDILNILHPLPILPTTQ